MLTVFEIYESIQGESTHTGRPSVFIRLAACDLRCAWCDTPYAFTGGRKMTVEAVLAEAEGFGTRLVEITGGELRSPPRNRRSPSARRRPRRGRGHRRCEVPRQRRGRAHALAEPRSAVR